MFSKDMLSSMASKDYKLWLFVCMCSFFCSHIHGNYPDMLFYTTRGIYKQDEWTLRAGVYGGRSDHHGNGTMDDLQESGFYCTTADSDDQYIHGK